MVSPADDDCDAVDDPHVDAPAPHAKDSVGADARGPKRAKPGDATDDGPSLADLASSVSTRAPAVAAPRIPPAPKIPPPPAIGSRTKAREKLAFEFDLGDDAGPMSLSRLTSGPARPARPARPAPAAVDEEASTIAREEAGAASVLAAMSAGDADTSADAPSDTEPSIDLVPADADSSGRSVPPRLPMPGMLGKRAAPEFRDARRPAKAPMGPGVLPPGGVMPPGAPDGHTAPEDTALLIGEVAAELMEPEPEPELEPEPAAASLAAAAASRATVAPVASVIGSRVAREKKLWIYGAAVSALLVLSIWAIAGDADEPATDKHAVTKPPANAAAAPFRDPAPEPDAPEPEGADDEPVAAEDPSGDDAAATPVDVAADDVALDTGADAVEGTVDAAAIDDEDDELAIVDPEPAEAAAAPAPAPSTASSKKSRTSRKRSKGSTDSSPASSSSAKPSSAPAETKPSAAASDGDDPKALLAAAKKALSAGNGARAYSLAAKSHRQKYNTDAIEVMTVASCMKGDPGRAKSLFKQVPLFRRSGVKNKCKAHGVKLGL